MYILAIDQGTTGTTTIVYNKDGEPVRSAYREFDQFYPQPGWVEHDPEEIWRTVVDLVNEVRWELEEPIIAIGITNQRETTVIWDRKTGKPIHNAIVWQCRRTAEYCKKLDNKKDLLKKKTGLLLDAYFSASKINWLLQNAEYEKVEDLCFGTIDSWLLWKLSGQKIHATDHTNASRTLLYNIEEKAWDQELLDLFEVPKGILPEIKNSIDDYGVVETIDAVRGVPIYSVAGDQQAALFGQACFEPGGMKNTYGTGSFLIMNTGQQLVQSTRGLVTTIAVDTEGKPCYALEGAIFIAGAGIQWLRDELNLLTDARESEFMATAVESNGGVYFVPALVGLGAPYWNMDARGTISGLTRGSNKNHIVRAALEAICYQSKDVITIMEEETGIIADYLMVDGGAVKNSFLMQFQADILKKTVLIPEVIESTSLGVAFMAGLKVGLWENAEELRGIKKTGQQYYPNMEDLMINHLVEGWQQAVEKTIT